MSISEKFDSFFSGYKKLTFKKGETIIRPEDEAYSVYYLKKGYARLYALSQNAQELTFIIYKPGDFFPLIPAINNVTNEYYTEAMTPIEVYQVPVNEFRNLVENNSGFLLELTNRLLSRFGGLLTRMKYSLFGNAKNKVAAILLICAERFGIADKNSIVIQIPLTHQDIANLLGVARETVSIEMKKLQDAGLIDYRNKCPLVKNLQKLQDHSMLEL